VASGGAPVTVQTAAGTSTPVMVASQPFSPAFFPWPNGQPVATHLDYSWAVKNGTFAGATTVPAKPGEYIILWGTGFGPTTPTSPTGVTIPASTTYYTANAAYVLIGGVKAPVYATALASGFAGLYQVVAMVPATLSNGDYSLVATVGGVAHGHDDAHGPELTAFPGRRQRKHEGIVIVHAQGRRGRIARWPWRLSDGGAGMAVWPAVIGFVEGVIVKYR